MPTRCPRSRRRRGRWRRRLRSIGRARGDRADRVGVVLVIATGPGRSERHARHPLRAGVGRGDYSTHVFAARPRLAPARSASPVRRRLPAGRRRPRRPELLTLEHVGSRQRRRDPRRRCSCTPACSAGCARRSQVPLTGSGSSAPCTCHELLFPGLRSGEVLERHGAAAARRRSWRATARRWPRGPTAPPRSPTSPPDRRHARADPGGRGGVFAAAGYPPKRRSGSTGSSASSRRQLAGTPGGTLFAGHRVLAHSAGLPGHDGHDDDRPGDRARRGRRDGRPLRRHRRDGPAHRRAACPRRGRLLGAAAAGLDDEDHHRDRRARGRNRQAQRHVPDPDAADDRRLHSSERQRRGLRRHAAQRVRRLM